MLFFRYCSRMIEQKDATQRNAILCWQAKLTDLRPLTRKAFFGGSKKEGFQCKQHDWFAQQDSSNKYLLTFYRRLLIATLRDKAKNWFCEKILIFEESQLSWIFLPLQDYPVSTSHNSNATYFNYLTSSKKFFEGELIENAKLKLLQIVGFESGKKFLLVEFRRFWPIDFLLGCTVGVLLLLELFAYIIISMYRLMGNMQYVA